ncbi:hypothetical protein GGR35_003835 [Mucilaginibacter phyllosphaerae]|uniref:Uncharacterized protein n=1 Tax=Mucilaginibacter phyllosphaerae TaxID=1812349 RepID=A0ABR6IDR5_9SPHI|nr:hypothetical protein [Mucilaginibacter phyllosphaerae]
MYDLNIFFNQPIASNLLENGSRLFPYGLPTLFTKRKEGFCFFELIKKRHDCV